MESEMSLPHFDIDFAGGSVMKIGRYLLTSSSIQKTEVNGEMKAFVRIRINQEAERIKLFVGDILTLSDSEKYKVVFIETPETRLDRGKVYFVNLEEET